MAGPVQPAFVQASTTNFAAAVTSMAPALSGVGGPSTLAALVLHISSLTLTSGYIATAVTDTGGGTWLRGPSVARTGGACETWYCIAPAAGTHTLTVTTNSGTNGCELQEFSGVAGIAPILDLLATNSGSSGTVTASLTPSNVNELLTFNTFSTNAQTAPPSAPFTNRNGPTNGGAIQASNAYVAANGLISAYAPTWTQTSSNWGCVGVALKGASSVGNVIWNDTAAALNPGIFETQARPDYFDSVVGGLPETGTGVLSGCAVSPNTGSDFKFQVAAGTELLNWAPISVGAVTAQLLTAADLTNPRRDLVYVTQAGTVVYVAGVANATPCPPTLPVNCVQLAIIEVPANATTLVNGTSTSNAYVTDKRVFLNFGPSAPDFYFMASGVLGETVRRDLATAAAAAPTSGRLQCSAIALPAGLSVGHITFVSVAAANTPTDWWFCLLDKNLNLLAVTADQTTTAWGASTAKTLPIATTAQGSQISFTTTYSGLYYVGFMMAATGLPTLLCATEQSNAAAVAPILFGVSTSGLTAAPTFPFVGAALNLASPHLYASVST